MSIVPSPPPNASATTRGLVSTGAQEFAGAKTLTGAILNGVSTIAEAVTSLVRAVGASLVLRSSLGAGASDVAVKVGTSETDAGTNASAQLLSVRTGLGGTEVEKFYVRKDGGVVLAAGADLGAAPTNPALRIPMTGLRTHILQIGGDTAGTWEFALGHYDYPLLKSRTSLYVETAAGGFVAPVSPAGTHLGSLANHWGSAFLAGTVQLGITGAARPTANATNRGTLWYSRSANGAADTIEICLKSAADTYSWVVIATG